MLFVGDLLKRSFYAASGGQLKTGLYYPVRGLLFPSHELMSNLVAAS